MLDALAERQPPETVRPPGGQVALLDWRPDAASSGGPPPHLRLSPAVVTEHLQAAGLQLLPARWQHEDGYIVRSRSGDRFQANGPNSSR